MSVGTPILSVPPTHTACTVEAAADTISHYDVEINPVVNVLGQKKPKGLLRAVWEQLCLDQVEQNTKYRESFAVCAFDGRRNVFTPVKMPIPDGESALMRLPLGIGR